MSLAETFDRLVADHEVWRPPLLTPRRATLPRIAGKADAIVGMRRTGKTCLMLQTLCDLEARGIPRARTLYVNFEDERIAGLKATELSQLTEALWRRHPDARGEECWLFLDEVQNVPGWEQFVRRVQDAERCRVVVTGSSAKLLSTEVATSLRGRGMTTELSPFSFQEFLLHHGRAVPTKLPPANAERSRLEAEFGRYAMLGGFPEVQKLDDSLRRRVLRDYVDVVLLRDVAERHSIGNLTALRATARRLLRSPTATFSVNKVFLEFKSQGLSVSKDALHAYLAHFQDAFLVFPIERWSKSVRQRQVNPKRCYLIDPALAATYSFEEEADIGHKLENLVYLELRRRGGEISYYVTQSAFEVDFYVERDDGSRELVQVCADLGDASTLERELRALDESLRERKLQSATIVTRVDERTLQRNGRTIRIVPAWRWMLE